MFDWFRKKIILGLPELEEISSILFPPLEIHKNNGSDFYVDYSIDSNLEAIMNDINTKSIDATTINSLKHVLSQVKSVRNILDSHEKLRRKVNYFVVANKTNDSYLSDILEETVDDEL